MIWVSSNQWRPGTLLYVVTTGTLLALRAIPADPARSPMLYADDISARGLLHLTIASLAVTFEVTYLMWSHRVHLTRRIFLISVAGIGAVVCILGESLKALQAFNVPWLGLLFLRDSVVISCLLENPLTKNERLRSLGRDEFPAESSKNLVDYANAWTRRLGVAGALAFSCGFLPWLFVLFLAWPLKSQSELWTSWTIGVLMIVASLGLAISAYRRSFILRSPFAETAPSGDAYVVLLGQTIWQARVGWMVALGGAVLNVWRLGV